MSKPLQDFVTAENHHRATTAARTRLILPLNTPLEYYIAAKNEDAIVDMLSQLELRLAKVEALCKIEDKEDICKRELSQHWCGFVGRADATNVMDKVA
jgi:hypothetical protein